MATKAIITKVRIPVDLLARIHRLPLSQKTDTKRVAYLLRLGVRYHVILEKAAAEASKEDA